MNDFAILLKSHEPDLAYTRRAAASFARHNEDDVPMYVVVPDSQLPAFEPIAAADRRIELMPESAFAPHLVEIDVSGFSAGYINQEIVKLCFWESDLARNYLCLDSDAQFIRPFSRSDFMADPDTPFTFVSEDRELQAEPEYFEEHWRHREPRLRRIALELGVDADPLRTVHGHAVFSAAVLRSFRDEFLAPRGWDYVDALALAPYEPTWYTLWLELSRAIPIVYREPVFKTFHNASQHLAFLLRGLGEADLARGYVGVVVNSNYSRSAGLVDVGEPLESALAKYVPEQDLLRSALAPGRKSPQP